MPNLALSPIGANAIRLATEEGRNERIRELVALGDYYADANVPEEASRYYDEAVRLGAKEVMK